MVRGTTMVQMRRKERLVTDFNALISIIKKCEVLRLGLSDGDYPYIVPVNFSFEADETTKQIDFYIHGAIAGRKYDLLTKSKKCSFEMDTFIELDYLYENHDITTRYESIYGIAEVEEIPMEQKEKIMQDKFLSRWEEASKFPWNKEALSRTTMYKISVKEITGKVNPVRNKN